MSNSNPITCIDTSKDADLEKLQLNWLPWVGKDYFLTEPKTIILGESTYNWGKTPEERLSIQENRIESINHVRILHRNHVCKRKTKAPFVRNIERAIFQQKNPDFARVQKMWQKVCYHNLVLDSLDSRRKRPSYQQYYNGWLIFLRLCNILQIDQGIVYGLEQKKLKAVNAVLKQYASSVKMQKLGTEKIGRSYPRKLSFCYQKRKIALLFIRHPSSFFSWSKWGKVLHNELQLAHLI